MHSPGRLKAELRTSPDRNADGAAQQHSCPAGRLVGKANRWEREKEGSLSFQERARVR
jgi:hypothetical protein